MHNFDKETRWVRFWHEPVRAERLALVRILVALSLLTDQLLCIVPHLGVFFGPEGVGYAGLYDRWLLDRWRFTILFFGTDDLTIIRIVAGCWIAATVLFLIGWHTRAMSALVWFLTLCFINRNPRIYNAGFDVLTASLFLLMFMPTGRALSLDRWLRRRQLVHRGSPLPDDWDRPTVVPWGVRVLQIQLCAMYLCTGLAKLRGGNLVLDGTWWVGTSVYYALNNITLNRVAWPDLPLPFWMTVMMTYVSVWWEVLFTFLVLWRRTRNWTLWFGVLFHLGIWLLLEVGWFSFYTLSLYGAWVADDFWQRRQASRER